MNQQRYHSVYLDQAGAEPCQRWEGCGSVAFVHDVMNGPLPPEYDSCDVLYADLPWQQGFPRYGERAGVQDGRTYQQFMHRVSAIVIGARRPVVLVTGRHALRYLPEPSQIVDITMPVLNQGAIVANYNGTIVPELWPSTADLLSYLASAYTRIGDFCCGYGQSARAFAMAGKTFTASDFNPECIGYIAAHAPGWRP